MTAYRARVAQLKRLILRALRLDIRTRYPQYKVGRGTYGNPTVLSWGEQTILEVGSFCSIAPGVKIFLGGDHRTDWITTYPFSVLWKSGEHIKGHPKSKGNVIIGNDVYIGSDAIILSGVHIGDGAVIGAGSVITKDVPPYCIVVGNPASIKRKRFSDEVISSLLSIKWWNWSDKEIEKYLPLLLSENVDEFIDAVRSSKLIAE